MVSHFSIELQGISKRYDLQWVFRDLSFKFDLGHTYAIRGYNGSGKSTLIRILSSMESPSSGLRKYSINNNPLQEAEVFSHLSFTAPYMRVPEYLTVLELIQFHGKFKHLNKSPVELLSELNLKSSKNKQFEKLSSGQKQKVKLALAICNSDPLLILDEPGTNLDKTNYEWFGTKINQVRKSKLICIATNENRDLDLCDRELLLSEMNGD